MPSERLIELIISALGGGVLAAIVAGYRAKAQNNLDQAQAWRTLLEQQQNRVLEQQREIESLEQELAERDGYIDKVIRLLSKAGIEIPTYVFRRRYKTQANLRADQ